MDIDVIQQGQMKQREKTVEGDVNTHKINSTEPLKNWDKELESSLMDMSSRKPTTTEVNRNKQIERLKKNQEKADRVIEKETAKNKTFTKLFMIAGTSLALVAATGSIIISKQSNKVKAQQGEINSQNTVIENLENQVEVQSDEIGNLTVKLDEAGNMVDLLTESEEVEQIDVESIELLEGPLSAPQQNFSKAILANLEITDTEEDKIIQEDLTTFCNEYGITPEVLKTYIYKVYDGDRDKELTTKLAINYLNGLEDVKGNSLEEISARLGG